MVKIILLLIYLNNSELVIEKKVYDTKPQCEKDGIARFEEVMKHPRFEEWVAAACVEARMSVV